MITFTTAPTLTNGIIGGWAVEYVTEDSITSGANVEFATYDPVTGVSPLTAAEQYASFVLASGITGANVRLGANAIGQGFSNGANATGDAITSTAHQVGEAFQK